MRIRELFDGSPRRIITIEPSDTIADTVYLLKEHAIGAVIVTADGTTIDGIISERDVVRSLVLEHEGTLRLRVEELMTETVATCMLDDSIEAAMETMTDGRFRHMPIVDEDDHLIGIVSLGDLVNGRLRALEAANIELREYAQI